MIQKYSADLTISNLNFKKIKKLYGALKSIKTVGGNFIITNENSRFRLTTCSFLILLSMLGLDETFNIWVECYNPVVLEGFCQQIENLS